MKKFAKVLTLLLTVAMLSTGILPLYVFAQEEVSPYLLNTYNCACFFGAYDGEASASVTYQGKSSTFSHAVITVKIQKRFLGIFWSNVDEWTKTSYTVNGYVEDTTPLEKTGTYRAVFTVKIYGNDGSVDTIEDTITSRATRII